MANKTIQNAANQPISYEQGTIPDVSGALKDYFQTMTFTLIVKDTSAFQVVETPTDVTFEGVLQPFTERQLFLKPEGQRAWSWFLLHAEPVLQLKVDDVVTWNGIQTRVMSKKNYSMYGYVEYHMVQDWTGSGPGA